MVRTSEWEGQQAWGSPESSGQTWGSSMFAIGEDPGEDNLFQGQQRPSMLGDPEDLTDSAGSNLKERQRLVDDLPSSRMSSAKLNPAGFNPEYDTIAEVHEGYEDDEDDEDDLFAPAPEPLVDIEFAEFEGEHLGINLHRHATKRMDDGTVHVDEGLVRSYLKTESYCPNKLHRTAQNEPCRRFPAMAREDPTIHDKRFRDVANHHKRTDDLNLKGTSWVMESVRRRQHHMNNNVQNEAKRINFHERKNTRERIQKYGARYVWFMVNMQKASRSAHHFFRFLTWQPWTRQLHQVEGTFGTEVFNFFRFLRWMLTLSFIFMLTMTAFLVIPQAIEGVEHREGFAASDLITAEGYVGDSILFIGAYGSTNVTESRNILSGNYDIALSYLLSNLLLLIGCVLAILYSMAQRYRSKVYQDARRLYPFCDSVFSGWDHSVNKRRSVEIRQITLERTIRELIAWSTEEAEIPSLWRLRAKRISINVFILIILGGAMYLINYLAQDEFLRSEEGLRKFYAPFAIAGLNTILPSFFMILGYGEHFTPRFSLKLLKGRAYLLRMAGLYVLVVSLFRKNDVTSSGTISIFCRETQVGQEIYKLLLLSVLLTVLTTLGGDIGRNLVNRLSDDSKLAFLKKIAGRPNFQVAKSTLEILFLQALVWTGSYFSPMLPLVGTLGIILVFYVKYLSLFYFLSPSDRVFRGDLADNFNLVLLLFTLFLSMGPVGYAIVSIDPSDDCSPFRQMDSSWETVSGKVATLPLIPRTMFQFVGTAGFVVPVGTLFLLLAYYYYNLQRTSTHLMKSLDRSIKHLIQDKKHLIRKHGIR